MFAGSLDLTKGTADICIILFIIVKKIAGSVMMQICKMSFLVLYVVFVTDWLAVVISTASNSLNCLFLAVEVTLCKYEGGSQSNIV